MIHSFSLLPPFPPVKIREDAFSLSVELSTRRVCRGAVGTPRGASAGEWIRAATVRERPLQTPSQQRSRVFLTDGVSNSLAAGSLSDFIRTVSV